MRATAGRMRAAIREYEMMAKQRELSRNGEDPDQAAPGQTLADHAGLIVEEGVPSPDCSCCGLPIACPHQVDPEYEMLAKRRELSGKVEGPDQAAPDQAPADQAGLIAEGDVPSPDCSCCGLPIAGSRPCPH